MLRAILAWIYVLTAHCLSTPLSADQNVGKSSLINMLTGRKNLAKTSGQPGKTQKLNYFLIDRSWYIVDLPGYGYAKIFKAQRQKWQRMIQDYILRRNSFFIFFY